MPFRFAPLGLAGCWAFAVPAKPAIAKPTVPVPTDFKTSRRFKSQPTCFSDEFFLFLSTAIDSVLLYAFNSWIN
jgi:hypothetical protein